jgi:two-component system response regulator YesN
MKLTAMLVDDEPNILRNLQSVLPWEELGIEVAALARNGAEALAKAEEVRPDLVLSDIRMPLMDGIAFVRALREGREACEIVMVTGYQEFEYAKTLLKYGVSDYILKPIDYDGLERTIRELAASIRAKKRERRRQELRRNRMQRFAREKLLHDALCGRNAGMPQSWFLGEETEEGGGTTSMYELYVVEIDDFSRQATLWSEADRRLWNFAVGNVLHDAVQGGAAAPIALQMREGEWCLLIETAEPEECDSCLAGTGEARPGGESRPASRAERVQAAIAANVKLDVSVAAYPCAVPPGQLAEAYKKLQRAMQLGRRGRRALIVYGEREQAPDAASAGKRKHSEALMDEAKAYIHSRYAADFGIEDVACHLGISCSYFSLLFKQHYGETFLEYLTRLRMETAQTLLLHTDLSVTDIGRAVGFAERRYFSKVFHKFTGEIPSDYREKRRRNGGTARGGA